LWNAAFAQELESGLRVISNGIVRAQQIVGRFAGGFALEKWIGWAAKEENGKSKYGCEGNSGQYSQPKFHMAK